MKNLQELTLYNNQIQDISSLKDLKNLQKLYLSTNKIQNCDIKFKPYEYCMTEVKKWFNYLDFIENQNKFIKYGLDPYLIPDTTKCSEHHSKLLSYKI